MATRRTRPTSSRRSGAVTRRSFLRGAVTATGAALAAGAGLWWYSSSFEPSQLSITHLSLALPRLHPVFDGLKLAQVSDLHLGRYTSPRRLRQVVDAVLALQPSLVVITGDHVDRLDHGEAEVLAGEMARLTAEHGLYAILGNHDHWTNAEVVIASLKHAGLTVLRNAHTPITIMGRSLYLAGVDDVWEKKADLDKTLEGVPPEACVVLLAHEPDFADEAASDGRPTLQLSGHSHGGQVVLPWIGSPVLPYLGQKYPAGLRKVNEMTLYTSRGIGVVDPPVRVNCPPEVTLFELRSPAGGA